MSCSKCKSSKLPCGCEDTSLESGVVCNTEPCENPEPCPETFSAGCVVWTGPDLICNSTVIATEGMRMDQVLETMIALFCGPQTPPLEGFTLSHPDPNTVISSPDDQIICVDRNNCFDDLVVSVGPGAPGPITFDWTDIDGMSHFGDSTMLIENGRSCVLFSWDISGLPSGTHNFNFIITGCGTTVNVPIVIVIP